MIILSLAIININIISKSSFHLPDDLEKGALNWLMEGDQTISRQLWAPHQSAKGGGKVERKLAAMAPEMAAYILE